ncbi:hypothetical protein SK3146_05109 [Paenibacillus konkukensis]|uniref:Signal peptidase I n=1 Tax=Paenibacillus konkukensis TaxID=2020716 RepID=A0ABY4RVL5_9BACL|nr:S24/S26 family peptidase [Paenibacillus konkukensis]UQZ85820.1 hypothetical protein SK3146_05109 [Paenibacillus konkukensis]
MHRSSAKITPDQLSALLLPMLELNWNVAIPVTGNSMYPLWKHGRDEVVLTKCDPYALKKGDIVLYRRSTGQMVLHRIVKVRPDSYDMCGDAQSQIESKLPQKNVMAVVTSFTRKGREYSCGQFRYRVYASVWMWILRLRRIGTIRRI